MNTYTEAHLCAVGELAEHLDHTGARGAARVVRHHLSIMRCEGARSSAAELITWAADLVATAGRDLEAVREAVAKGPVTVEDCRAAAGEGEPGVASLVDTALATAVLTLAPMTFINRRYPVVSERVVLVDDLFGGDLADAWPLPVEMFGRVLEVDVPNSQARVAFVRDDEHGNWYPLSGIASLRTFGTAGE